jgi:UDP-N-acetylmuramate dehydrogenase
VDRDGEIRELGRDELRPGYRDGGLGDTVVLQATFDLHEDSPAAIYARFDAYLRRRNATQPVSQKSVGCVFKNPAGDAAGRLIEAAGGKLMRCGGISVSGKHANYFVNDGNGTAAEFRQLMEEIRARVRAAHGVELESEVKLWGP